jgi:hypothetical protein
MMSDDELNKRGDKAFYTHGEEQKAKEMMLSLPTKVSGEPRASSFVAEARKGQVVRRRIVNIDLSRPLAIESCLIEDLPKCPIRVKGLGMLDSSLLRG